MNGVPQPDPLLVRTFRALQAASPSALPQVVATLAGEGDVTMLRTILEHRLIDPAQWTGDKSMGVAIAPLARRRGPVARADAMEIVTAWSNAFGTDLTADLTSQLRQCRDPRIAAGLIALGADPLNPGPAFTDVIAPLRAALIGHDSSADLAQVMLDDCLARDRLPVSVKGGESALDWIANASWFCGAAKERETRDALAAHLAAQPLTLRWKVALGQALLASNKTLYAPLDDAHWEACTRRLLTLMPAAHLSAAQWGTLLAQGKTPMQFPGVLTTEKDLAPLAVKVVATMHAAGVDLDQPAAPLPRRQTTGTMLQAAVLANNAPVVAALLAAGADPRRTVVASAKGKPRDAFALAKAGTGVAHYLAAWKAQQAMAGALQADARMALTAGVKRRETS